MTPEQEARLPQYAQRALYALRNRVTRLEQRITQEAEGSRAFANPYDAAPLPLGPHPHVAFYLAPPEENDTYQDRLTLKLNQITRPGEPECLEVMSGRNLFIIPRASNVIELYTRPVSDRY